MKASVTQSGPGNFITTLIAENDQENQALLFIQEAFVGDDRNADYLGSIEFDPDKSELNLFTDCKSPSSQNS